MLSVLSIITSANSVVIRLNFAVYYVILIGKTLQQCVLFVSPYLLFKTCQSNLYDNLKTTTSIECLACLCFLRLITHHNSCSQNTQWPSHNSQYAFTKLNISLQASNNTLVFKFCLHFVTQTMMNQQTRVTHSFVQFHSEFTDLSEFK